MTEYTPTTDTTEDIRADFAGFPHRCNDCEHMDAALRFDRWLAARDAERDRQVAAEALEKAAEETPDITVVGEAVKRWLLDRAKTIRETSNE